MTQSNEQEKETPTGPFMDGPKPAAPIPKYDPGTDPVLKDRLRATSSMAMVNTTPADSENDSFTVAGIEGRIDRKKANVAGKLVDTDPDQALRVIRNWLLNE